MIVEYRHFVSGSVLFVQYSSDDQVPKSLEDKVTHEAEDAIDALNTVPDGMEAYETMDTNEVVINGVSDAST